MPPPEDDNNKGDSSREHGNRATEGQIVATDNHFLVLDKRKLTFHGMQRRGRCAFSFKKLIQKRWNVLVDLKVVFESVL